MRLFILSLLLLLGGCASVPQQKIVKVPIEVPVKVPLVCPDVARVAVGAWKKFKIVDARYKGLPVFGLTADAYEILAKNIALLQAVIKARDGEVKYYQQCIRTFNGEGDKED